jgi:oligoendopeptidase F
MFSILTDSDIRFEDAVSSKGKKVKMPTKADVMLCLRSNDRKVRETA